MANPLKAVASALGRITRDSGQNQNISGVFSTGYSRSSSAYDFQRAADAVYSNPYGRRAVDFISNQMCRDECRWEARTYGTEDLQTNSPLLELLSNPWQGTSGKSMLRNIGHDLHLAGRTTWLKAYGNDGLAPDGQVTGLYYLNPIKVTVIASMNDDLLGFIYSDGTGQRVPILPKDAVYSKLRNPFRPSEGLAPAVNAAVSAATDLAAAKFNYDVLSNDGALPGYIMVEDMDEEQFAAYKAAWSSGEYPGKTRFLGGKATYIKVGQSNADLIYDKLRAMAQEDMAVSMGLAYVLLSPTDSTFSNMDVAKNLAWQSTIKPILDMVSDDFENQLGLPNFNSRLRFNLSEIEELNEGKDAVFQREVQAIQNDMETVNAWREEQGKEPVLWGDYPYSFLHKSVSPAIAGSPDTYPLTLMPGGDEGIDPNEKSLKKKVIDITTKAQKDHSYREAFDRRAIKQEKAAEKRMKRFFDHQGKVIVAAIRSQQGKSFTKAIHPTQWWNKSRWDSELKDTASAFLVDTVDQFGSDVNPDFNYSDQSVQDYLGSRSTEIASLINGTTQDDVRATIAAQPADATINEIADAVAGYFDDNAAMRAERVARTEVIGAANYATVAGAQQMGLDGLTADVLTADDADEECMALADAGPYDMEEAKDLLPEHPNCRCCLLINTPDGQTEEGSDE